jgi:hypothetical protein
MQPVAYGLKFAGLFSGATLLQSDLAAKLQAAGLNATAYAAKRATTGQISVIILNKDAEKDLALRLDFGAGKIGAVRTETLYAQALESRDAQIGSSPRPGRLIDGKFTVLVPRASGLYLTVG